jgi:Uma2 family endonuclease
VHAWRDRQDFFVAANMGLYFSETQSRRNDFRAPDLFVVLDVERRERRSWVVWEEDGRMPDVVVELVSDSTEDVDRGPKMGIYARALHVACYAIHDPWSGSLDVYHLDPARRAYEPAKPDAHGAFPCPSMGLSLAVVPGVLDGVEAPWLRWIDPQGVPLREPAEVARDAEAEIARLHAELARLRGGST